ncbi:hypothetical protein [Nonomuraea sp. NPDC050310]|uniref:hypothetical protein n=1 Tax=Nonomuraea sp. NPDC050310 TaxID=3154935 RepID=UPI0033F194E7
MAHTMTSDATPLHHGSHRHLLLALDAPVGTARVDAIVVPTVRNPLSLRHAVEVAGELGCPLVLLCSGRYTSAALAHWYYRDSAPEIIAIDVPDQRLLNLPSFATSRLLARTAGGRFQRHSDTSAKRNLALLLARLLGWKRLVFLDDDIKIGAPDDLRRAAGLLDVYSAAGLSVGGFPDNSVVCHANRLLGGRQDSFVGGGAMAVETTRTVSFFPDIYNEDWFYLLDGKGLQQLAVTGKVLQDPYDPFRTPQRARGEELGDVLAEGLFWLLDENKPITEADEAHWRMFLGLRRRFLDDLLARLRARYPSTPEQARMEEALKASRGRLELIAPDLCVTYLQAWEADRQRWARFLKHLAPIPAGLSRKRTMHLAVSRLFTAPLPQKPLYHSIGHQIPQVPSNPAKAHEPALV